MNSKLLSSRDHPPCLGYISKALRANSGDHAGHILRVTLHTQAFAGPPLSCRQTPSLVRTSASAWARPFPMPVLTKTGLIILTGLCRLIFPTNTNKDPSPVRLAAGGVSNSLCKLRMAAQTRKGRLHPRFLGTLPDRFFPTPRRYHPASRKVRLLPSLQRPSPRRSPKPRRVRPEGADPRRQAGGVSLVFGSAPPHAQLAVIGCISPMLSNQEATAESEVGLRFPRGAGSYSLSSRVLAAIALPCPSAVTQQESATGLGRKGRAEPPFPGPRH